MAEKLHFKEPSAYQEIYLASTTRFLKDPALYRGFPGSKGLFATSDPRLAKERKEWLDPSFSVRGISRIHNMVNSKV